MIVLVRHKDRNALQDPFIRQGLGPEWIDFIHGHIFRCTLCSRLAEQPELRKSRGRLLLRKRPSNFDRYASSAPLYHRGHLCARFEYASVDAEKPIMLMAAMATISSLLSLVLLFEAETLEFIKVQIISRAANLSQVPIVS